MFPNPIWFYFDPKEWCVSQYPIAHCSSLQLWLFHVESILFNFCNFETSLYGVEWSRIIVRCATSVGIVSKLKIHWHQSLELSWECCGSHGKWTGGGYRRWQIWVLSCSRKHCILLFSTCEVICEAYCILVYLVCSLLSLWHLNILSATYNRSR